MRFALLGEHPDGVGLALALADCGRHRVVAVVGDLDEAVLKRLGGQRVSDVEEVLANPAVEAVIVAGGSAVREGQLRRALQSERHVLCVHPADEKPDLAYEAGMIQGDTKQVLLPVLVEALHPAVGRLREFLDREGGKSPVGAFRLLKYERQAAGEVLANADGVRPSLPGWDVLRHLGGELGEVSTFCADEGLAAGQPVLVAGRFEAGGLFQMTLVPRAADGWRLSLVGSAGQADLHFPQGWDGPAFLTWGDEEEAFARFDPWPAVVAAFEAAVAGQPAALLWQDEVRMLELDDAARYSVGKRRVQQMEYQEASEAVGFKGTMTMVGCALVWGVLTLLFLSLWQPWLGWLILPLLLVFVGMQFLRLLIR